MAAGRLLVSGIPPSRVLLEAEPAPVFLGNSMLIATYACYPGVNVPLVGLTPAHRVKRLLDRPLGCLQAPRRRQCCSASLGRTSSSRTWRSSASYPKPLLAHDFPEGERRIVHKATGRRYTIVDRTATFQHGGTLPHPGASSPDQLRQLLPSTDLLLDKEGGTRCRLIHSPAGQRPIINDR